MSGLTEQTAETARRYLARLPELTPAAQAELGQRIAGAVSAQVSPPPPPGTPAWAYLSAVLAERRNREHARLAAAPGYMPGPAPGAQPAAPYEGQPPAPPGGPVPPGAPGGQPAWRPVPGAAREQKGPPDQQLHARGTGGFVPPA